LKRHTHPGQVVQWPGYTHDVLHESPIVGRQFAKCPDLRNVCWLWPSYYGGYFVRITFDPLVTYSMATDGTWLAWVSMYTFPVVKDSSQSVTMFLRGLTKDQNVV